MILLFLAPESPWWLIRRGRKAEALRSIERLGDGSAESAQQSLAMMERTVQIESQMGGSPTLLDLFKGTDLRRTTITCLVYASQNFAGNLIANQATFFFEREFFISFSSCGNHFFRFFPLFEKDTSSRIEANKNVQRLESPTTCPSNSISSTPVSN